MIKFINKISISIFIILFFFYFIFLLSTENFPLGRHWSSFYDHELTLAYNALLFNSGKLQEYVDHSGYFTILFLSIFFKILNFLDLLSVYKITLFNQNNNLDQDLQNIIYFTRLFGIFSVAIYCLVAFWTFNLFSKNKFLSFLITVILFLSFGTHTHFYQLRTELISMIFLVMSFFCLSYIFFLEKKIFITKYLIFFFIFFFCATLNKAQVFFYLPFILLITYFIKTEGSIYFNLDNYKFLENKNFINYFILLIIIYFLIKLVTGTGSILSIIFIFFNVLLINIFFYKKFKIDNIEIKKNLKIINLLLVVSYILFRSILSTHPSTNELAFNNTFTDIINNTFKYTSISSGGDKSFLYLILEIFINFKRHLFIIFSSLNYYSALISISLLLNLINKKNKTSVLFNLTCIFSFFLILAINGLRGNENNLETNYYFIFSDFFLVLSLTPFKEILNKKFYLTLITILGLIFYLNYKIIKSINIPDEKIKILCNDTYFYDWHKSIPPIRFEKYCEKNL